MVDLQYTELLTFVEKRVYLKNKEKLGGGFYLSMVTYAQLLENFKLNKNTFTDERTGFKKDVCTSNEQLIAKVYKLLWVMNQEDEYIKDYMIK